MASVNKVILIGHLGKDPEMRYLPSGDPVTNFSVATSEKWKDKDGQKQERTEWSRCSAFGKTAEVIGEYCKKGSMVYVEGKLQTRKYQKDGQDHYATEIRVDRVQFLSPRGASSEPKEPAAGGAQPAKKGGNFDQMDDDIPF